MNVAHPERGDTELKTLTHQRIEKIISNMKKSTNEESKSKYLIYGVAEKEFPRYQNDNKDVIAKSYSDLRKRIRDRYTLKLSGLVNKSDHCSLRTSDNKKEDSGRVTAMKTDSNKSGVLVDRSKRQLTEETTQTNEQHNPSPISSSKTLNNVNNTPEMNYVKTDKAKPTAKTELKSVKKRKPIIKTIMSKNGSVRIFKAVTFVDQKSPTPLEIKIPNNVINKKQQKVSKFTETCPIKHRSKIVVSKASIVQENLPRSTVVRKKIERKRERRFRHAPSPQFSTNELVCPQTEVAKWAPASIDPQTKPYYEAWVNTSPAAISTGSMKDKQCLEDHAHLMRSFHRALEERPESPELFYAKFADENYTGKIRIRQADRIRRK